MCVSQNAVGAGLNYTFASDDPALNNNAYQGGIQVSDQILGVRNRNANWVRSCVYVDFNYLGGEEGHANFVGEGWKPTINQFGSSIRGRAVASC
jgi:hypothetical protein